ncbi:ABC transporter substrate-binding protein [Kaistia sp. 32K]|uniref:ABC transporter substrate-binding protein n=1 Tax=Kaistia sp. 32K TaxID=2795690 RepID=UPI001915962D|nr:ABC transporter substrate-binding protein [Kaistia sp. 32K]
MAARSGGNRAFRALLFTAALLASTAASAQEYRQAPGLDSVAGLPPIAERLPSDPLVVPPVESIGQYGGTLRNISRDELDWLRQLIMVEPFARFERDVSGVRPNVLKGWTWNDAYTEVTMNFRKGMKWSDGEPFTADDFMFFWNDLVLDESIPVGLPSGTVVNEVPMTVDKIDDYTVKLTFAAPNPLFMELASRGHYNSAQWLVPAHYLKQFHPKYAEVKDTTALMARYNATSRLQQVGMPTLAGWVVTEYTPGQRIVAQRNPYYWKVDPDGQQLPYIDTIDTAIATPDSARQAVLLKGMAGQLDFQAREFNLSDVSLLMENQESGDYTIKMWSRGDFAWPWLMITYDHKDQGIVDLFYEQKFRIALSQAMDRNKYNDVVSFGLAKPRQFSMSPESPEFRTPEGQELYEQWSSSYVEHDPELAKKLLDELGVVDKDGDGRRDRPDGSKLQLIVDMPASDPQTVAVMDLVKEDWDAIGIDTILNPIDNSALTTRAESGAMMMRAWPSAAGWGLMSAPTVWAPVEAREWSMGGISISRHFQSGGTEGTAPRKGSMLEKLQEAYALASKQVDPAARDAALLDAYRIYLEDGPITLGTIGEHPSPVLVSNKLHNVPDTGMIGSHDFGFPATADPEQFYFSK